MERAQYEYNVFVFACFWRCSGNMREQYQVTNTLRLQRRLENNSPLEITASINNAQTNFRRNPLADDIHSSRGV